MKSKYLALLIFVFLISGFSTVKAACMVIPDIPDTNGLRSDTINVLSYTITMNITDFTYDTLKGNTVVRFTPKMNNIHTLSLDLLHFIVDSVMMGTNRLNYSYDDTLLILDLPSVENAGDTNSVDVFYHGRPVLDPSGFGGFYFESGYAFNLGVGFVVKPHNFGRCWYPCFDNFVAKSTFVFNITTDSVNRSFCNGYLTKDSVYDTLRTRTWIMPYPISSYHACVDVAPYATMQDTFRGIDTLPITIAGEPADTSNIRRSFVHLNNAISIFQNCYGKYRWNKVGYSMMPFADGSMEHATNIAFPQLAANGTTTYEWIMAHELSHHWCGDLVTCRTAEDMWLNEGFAVFNQSIFMEYLYGDSTYNTYTRANHENVVHYCAIADHGYWPLSGMPQAYTYGNLKYWVSTTYQKGADVFHTLRTYLGDSNFFNGMKYYFSSHAYQPVNADTLKNSLERYSGYNLTDFFNNWVFAPGFPQFSIDSMIVAPEGNNYNATVFIKQKLMGAPWNAYYNNVPVEVNFKSSAWGISNQTILVSGQLSSYTLSVPFNPVFVGLNMRTKIAEAVSSDTLKINRTGNYNMSTYSRVNLTVNSISDSAFLFLEHNYVAPDPIIDTSLHYRLSPYRYWNVNGIRPPGFSCTAKLYFDGRKSIGITSGSCYLDTILLPVNSDSLILLYRPDTKSDWHVFPGYSKTILTPTYGYMALDSLPNGQYTFADSGVYHIVGINKIANTNNFLKIFPNPTSGSFTVSISLSDFVQYLFIYDVTGKQISQIQIAPGKTNCIINGSSWKNGTYLISLRNENKETGSGNIVINH
jgi:aminopeptidase N